MKKQIRIIKLFLLLLLPSSLIALVVSCEGPPIGMDNPAYCPANPMLEYCPHSSKCSGRYECVSYCVRTYPENKGIPESGRGAWCSDSRIPDFAEFCYENSDVNGCPEWCANYGSCHPSQDGGVDGDADGDVAQSCTTDEQCEDTDTPVCDDGSCVQCSSTNSTPCSGETPHCLASQNICVGCTAHTDCNDPSKPYCDATTNTCQPCTTNDHCAHDSSKPVCDNSNGTCVQCTSYNDCDLSAGLVCNYTNRTCVTSCQGCLNDQACLDTVGPGFVCAVDVTNHPHCLQKSDISTCEQPWQPRTLDTPTPNITVDVCAPAETTSCFGLKNYGRTCDSSNLSDDCGDPTVNRDAVCMDGIDMCTYNCLENNDWCPQGSSCSYLESGVYYCNKDS